MCTLTDSVPSEKIFEKRECSRKRIAVNVREKDCTVQLDRLLSFLSLEARLSTTQTQIHPLFQSLQREGQLV